VPNPPGVLVLGIGNTLLGDEGAGVRAMEMMRDSHPKTAIRYVDGGTLSFTLTRFIEEADCLVVFDAANFGGNAGEWKCYLDAGMDDFLAKRGRSVHEVSLSDLLDIARLTERLPTRRAMFGIQTRAVGWSDRLSPQVAAAVREASSAAWELVQSWSGLERSIPQMDSPGGSDLLT